MANTKYLIVLVIFLISNFKCNKDVALPEVKTIGVTSSEWWDGLNYLRLVYIGEGKIIADGGADLISKGICFSTVNESPTIADSFSSDISDNISFKCMLNLQYGQVKYYLRAFAKNKGGISYGETVTYTTYCGYDFDMETQYKLTPTLVFPSNGATGLPLSVNLSWINPNGSCDLYLDTSPDASTKIASNVKSSSFKIDNLSPLTTYYWKVVKQWTPCSDKSSLTRSFTTTP